MAVAVFVVPRAKLAVAVDVSFDTVAVTAVTAVTAVGVGVVVLSYLCHQSCS